MASVKDIPYSFKAPYTVVGIVNQILGLDHKTDTKEEDKVADRFKAREIIIAPENAGELWRHKETNGYFHTDYSTQDNQLCLIGYSGISRDVDITHNENWERLFPVVEKDLP